MSVLQVFTDVKLVNQALNEAGVVRIPFTSLNNSLLDLISVYTNSVLSFTEHAFIRQALLNEPVVTDIDSCSLYVFKHNNYKLFLQMAANEDVVTDTGASNTINSAILYSTGSYGSLLHCPVYTEGDTALFSSIENSQYAKVLPSNEIHLLKIESELRWASGPKSNIVEYLLYVP